MCTHLLNLAYFVHWLFPAAMASKIISTEGATKPYKHKKKLILHLHIKLNFWSFFHLLF